MIYNIERLKKKMNEHKLDAILFTSKENILYVSGYSPVSKVLNPYGSDAAIVVTSKHLDTINIIQPLGEVDQILDAKSKIGFVNTYGEFYRQYNEGIPLLDEEQLLLDFSDKSNNFKNAYLAILDMFYKLNLKGKRIGVDFDGINYKTRENLLSIEEYIFVDATQLIREVRSIKTQYEINIIEKGIQCFEKAFLDVYKNKNNLKTELDVVQRFCDSITKYGGIAHLPMIKIGRYAVGGQRIATNNKLNEEDMIWFDCDIQYNGYWVDMARIINYNRKDIYKKYNILKKAQREAIEEIKHGMTAEDVFHLVMDKVHRGGYPEYKRQHVGHGIGLEPYELPILCKGNKEIIRNGMVLCIETPYYEYGLGALHIEDPILICENGNRILSHLSPDIFD